MRWGIHASNCFFRTIYCGKLWLSRSQAMHAVEHGWNMLDSKLQTNRANQINFWGSCTQGSLRRLCSVELCVGLEAMVRAAKNTYDVPCDDPRLQYFLHSAFQFLIFCIHMLGTKSWPGIRLGQSRHPVDTEPAESEANLSVTLRFSKTTSD